MQTLPEKLHHLKAYKKERVELAEYIIVNPEEFVPLLNHCFDVDSPLSYKAAWILEVVCILKPKLLFDHLDLFFDKVPTVHKEQAVRPMAKICELLVTDYFIKDIHPLHRLLTEEHKNKIVEVCFDWLITDQKVACKAYAMQVLFLLGKEIKWVHPELKIILQKDFPSEKPAFKARARHILKKMT